MKMLYFSAKRVRYFTKTNKRYQYRYLVRFGGKDVLLSWYSFRLLFDLSVQSAESKSGWVDRFNLCPGGYGIRNYMYRLREALAQQGVDYKEIVCGDYQGNWRILVQPHNIKIHAGRLLELDDPGIRRWVLEIYSQKKGIPIGNK